MMGYIMECKSCPKSDFTADLNINGKKVELNPFVQAFISNAVIGMTQSLENVDNVESLELKITKK